MFDDQTTSRWIPRNKLGLPVQAYAQVSAPRRATEDATWSRGMDHSAQTEQVRRVVARGNEQPTHRRWPPPPPPPTHVHHVHVPAPAPTHVHHVHAPAPAPRTVTQPISHRIRTSVDQPRVMRTDASASWQLAKDVAAMQPSTTVPLWLRSFLPGVALFAATLFGVVILFVEPPAMLAFEAKPADAEVSIDGQRIDDANSPFIVKGLAEGEHTLLLQKTGFDEVRQTFNIVWGQTLRLPEIVLERAFKQVAPVEPVVEPAPAAAEQLSPRARRAAERAAAAAERAAVAAEKAAAAHAAAAARPAVSGREKASSTATPTATSGSSLPARSAAPAANPRPAPAPKAAEPVSVVASEEPEPAAKSGAGGLGMLRINSRPWSQVSVDGRKIGNTPIMGVPLPAGDHEVELVNESMGVRKTLQVKVKRDEIVTKVVLLVD